MVFVRVKMGLNSMIMDIVCTVMKNVIQTDVPAANKITPLNAYNVWMILGQSSTRKVSASAICLGKPLIIMEFVGLVMLKVVLLVWNPEHMNVVGALTP